MLVRLLLVAVLVLPLAVAAQPDATVFTSGPLKINGVEVANAGIPSLPLAAGDELATTTESALVVFRDGSRITMGKQARARLITGNVHGLDLLAGSAAYKSASSSNFAIHALGRPVDVKSLTEGMVSITGKEKVTLRAKRPEDNDDNPKGNYKKPKPRSDHGRDDDKP